MMNNIFVFLTFMNYLKVVHEGGNTQQRMRHQVIGGPGDNITVSSSLLSLARVKLSQAGQYTCKPPGTQQMNDNFEILYTHQSTLFVFMSIIMVLESRPTN